MLLLKKADEIRKELHKIENTKKPTKTQKERYYRYLIELMNVLDKKEKYKHSNYNDLNYFGIRDIENLFISADDDYDYYEPALVKGSFEGNYEYYEIRGDMTKKLSIHQYLYMIIPKLEELINKRKNSNCNKQKVQLSIGVNFMSINDKEITHTFYVKSDNVQIMLGIDTSDIINNLFYHF